jgi:hypothetical protein
VGNKRERENKRERVGIKRERGNKRERVGIKRALTRGREWELKELLQEGEIKGKREWELKEKEGISKWMSFLHHYEFIPSYSLF